jgi:hypothetical protein
MQHIKPHNATRVLAEDQDEYDALAIIDADMDGINCMTSVWRPSTEELQVLMEGGYVALGILGHAHPPVMLSVLRASANDNGKDARCEPAISPET